MNKAWIRRRSQFDQQTSGNLLFRVWIGMEHVEAVEDEQTRTMFYKWYGTAPQFLTEAIIRWGGLTPKQYDFALRKFHEVFTTGRQRYETLQAQKGTLIKSGCVWVAGRKEVTLEILSIKERMFGPKLLGKTQDGMKLWVSLPNGAVAQKGNHIKMTVTVKPSDDDPTFAFGSRPTKWAII